MSEDPDETELEGGIVFGRPKSRASETRTADARPVTWQPASLLPEPDKVPGYAYRWVRISLLNNPDARNISSAFREGWVPVKAEEQPDLALFADDNPKSRFKGNIEVGGLLLCKIPQKIMDQRKQYFADMTAQQMAAVDNNFMRENDRRMPLFNERKSTVSFGKGK